MKKFFISHGEKVICALVVAVCLWVIVDNLIVPERAGVKALGENSQKIKNALENNQVAPNWPEERRDSRALVQQELDRPQSGKPQEEMPVFAFYPQPQRPGVKEVTQPEIRRVTAVLSPPLAFTVKAGHTGVALACQPPKDLAIFHPVRIEIYRGLTEDKIDENVKTFELGPEEQPDTAVGVAVPAAPVPGPLTGATPPDGGGAPGKEAAGTTARTVARGGAGGKAAPKPKKPADLLEYTDAAVKPLTTYYYRARLLGRLFRLEANNFYHTGQPDQCRVVVPPDLQQVPGVTPGVSLHASPWTAVAKDTIPPEYEVRFAGVIGQLPKIRDPRVPPSGYRGNFTIRKWAKDQWGEATVQIEVGKAIAGKAGFQVGAKQEALDYDFGYLLEEIREGNIVEKKTVRQPVTRKEKVKGPDGKETGEEVDVPALDAEGRAVFKDLEVESKRPTEIAILKDVKTEKTELYPTSKTFERPALKIEFPQEEEGGGPSPGAKKAP